MRNLDRRSFLTLAGASAGALSLGACSWREQMEASVAATTTTSTTTTSAAPLTDPGPTSSGRPLLVVVNLGGGNDALNTVVPATGRYFDLRPAVGLPDEQLIPLAESHGLHPSLQPLAHQWDGGTLAVVQGVGLPGQTRSHFAATDALFAAQADYASTGWIGRWLDTHPAAGTDPLLGVALGGGRSAMLGETASATVITRPDQFLLQTAPGMDAEALAAVLRATAGPTGDSGALDLVRDGIPKAMHAVELLADIDVELDATAVAPTSASTLLSVAAQIVELNLSTEVVLVDLGGYDTHSNQLETHAALLADVASGIADLLTSVEQADRNVLVLTTSEFGRRAADNGSGTDHGTAGSSLLVGSRVKGGRIVGELALDRLIDGDLPIDIDTRSVYANAIAHLGGDPEFVLGGNFDQYGLL